MMAAFVLDTPHAGRRNYGQASTLSRTGEPGGTSNFISPMRQLGVSSVTRNNPKLTHGAGRSVFIAIDARWRIQNTSVDAVRRSDQGLISFACTDWKDRSCKSSHARATKPVMFATAKLTPDKFRSGGTPGMGRG